MPSFLHLKWYILKSSCRKSICKLNAISINDSHRIILETPVHGRVEQRKEEEQEVEPDDRREVECHVERVRHHEVELSGLLKVGYVPERDYPLAKEGGRSH